MYETLYAELVRGDFGLILDRFPHILELRPHGDAGRKHELH